jgi:hypothetical protein
LQRCLMPDAVCGGNLYFIWSLSAF